MTTPLAPRVAALDAMRVRDAAQYLRSWVVSRYPGMRVQEHLSDSLSVPTYRPEFVPGKSYGDTMLPFVERVVAEAELRARQVAPLHLSTGTRPVLMAVHELTAPRRGGR